MSKIAMLGGSFNPIHNAHIELAQLFIKEKELDEVLLVPTYITPLKDNTEIITPLHRLSMCELAARDYEKIRVSDIEIERKELSYTSVTLQSLHKLYENDELFLIVGADMFSTLLSWHDVEKIFELSTILVAPRNETDYSDLLTMYGEYKKRGCRAYISKKPVLELSSTQIREMIKSDKDISGLVPQSVFQYIQNNYLYR